MRAVYDLAHCPASFDVGSFLMDVERERIARGEDDIELDVLPGPQGGFRGDNLSLWPHSIAERQRLLDNVVVPMCLMLPSVRDGVLVRSDRPESLRGVFGHGAYSMHFRKFVEAYAKGIRPLRPAGTIPVSGTLITITLREGEHWPERNSNLLEWTIAASWLRERGHRVVFVRDTCNADVPLPHNDAVPEASKELHTRGALYRAAACNFFVNNGPAWLAMACDAPVLMLKPTCEELGGCYGSQWFKACGVEPGSQFPNAPAHQRIVWEEDTAENIVGAFEVFMGEQRAAA